MIEQTGSVSSVQGQLVRVLLGGQSGCPACDAGRGCGAGIFGRLLRRQPAELEIRAQRSTDDPGLPGSDPDPGQLKLSRGERVVIGIPEATFLSLLARFYLWPLLMALLAAGVGHHLATRMAWSGLLLDLATGLSALAVWFLSLRLKPLRELKGANSVRLLRRASTDPDFACLAESNVSVSTTNNSF